MHSAIAKSLSRLSRERLINLCIGWTKSLECNPYLAANRNPVETEDEDYLHETARNRSELVKVYTSFEDAESDLSQLSKKDIIGRIVDGDWRRGLSYDQLASIDFAYLEENDSSLRWSALKLVPLVKDEDGEMRQHGRKKRKIEPSSSSQSLPQYPEVTASIFVERLKTHISPLVKAHYYIHRLSKFAISIVRLCIVPYTPFGPRNTNVPRQGKSAMDASRVVYIALPDSCPYVYISLSRAHASESRKQGSMARTCLDVAVLKRIVLEAIPKALSRPHTRWSLEATNLTTKSFQAISLLRGSGKVGSSGGAFSQFTTNYSASPCQIQSEAREEEQIDAETRKRKSEAERRFGAMNGLSHARMDRVQVKIDNLNDKSGYKSKKRKRLDDAASASITITVSGNDVFAGLKRLALEYPEYVNLDKLPAIFTGEANGTTILV